ncbi:MULTISPECIES: hypothetical protein [unclassified Kribbella]
MHRILLLLLAPISLFAAPAEEVRTPAAPSYDVELTGSGDGTTWSVR